MRQFSTLALAALICGSVGLAATMAGCSKPVAMTVAEGGSGCTLDTQCMGDTPRCDVTSGLCVACLPQTDNCPVGSHCLAGANNTYSCNQMCRDSKDCPKFGATDGVCCSGSCFDITGDAMHCGACGTNCPAVANGQVACAKGACVVGSCGQGFADCDKSPKTGCETNTNTDPLHCGACGTTCRAGANGTAACQNGFCALVCKPNFGDCNNDPSDGCEADLTGDAMNCGTCSTRCPAMAHATAACQAGACGIAACDQGYLDCDHQVGNGCEVNLVTDKMNCGSCGNTCAAPNAVAACKSGVCGFSSCNQGYSDCDSNAANGCEVNTAADPANCGACRNFCIIPHAMAVCTNGACGIGACLGNYSDCNMVANDGCEDQISIDVQNCGMCGAPCGAVVHGVAGCANSMCNIASCSAGFANCSGNVQTGCETDITTTMNCGKCANVCPVPANATAGCAAGACGIGVCNALFGDCDKNAANGCELPLAVDPSNCGACGKVCALANAKSSCANGVCGLGACNVGYGDCDKNAANGCEALLTTDAKNCGACGNVCPNNLPNCSNSVCTNIFLPVGPQVNLKVAALAGWTECYRDLFSNGVTPLANILAACSGSKLMLACSTTGDPTTLVLAAWAPRADALFDEGQGNVLHNANGSDWYYSTSWSWGFTAPGDGVSRNSCDTAAGAHPDQRLCIHTANNNINGGYRCGTTLGLNGSNSWNRVIYQAN